MIAGFIRRWGSFALAALANGAILAAAVMLSWSNEGVWLLDKLPIVLGMIVVYSLGVEVVPKDVTRINSNAYTSQVLWNVTLKSLRFQLVNYLLYHQYWFSNIVHGITIIMDCLLWTMYFHQLLILSPAWAFGFVLFMCVLQALTFDDVKLKIYLIVIETILIGIAGVVYQYILDVSEPSDRVFGKVSAFLLMTALARVLSHAPEPLPIDYLGLHNKLPIYAWWKIESTADYMLNPARFVFATSVGVFSELQAGLPVRLLSSSIVMFLTMFGWTTAALPMDVLRERKDQICLQGWSADKNGSKVFAWEGETDVQQMFIAAAQQQYEELDRQGNPVKTWLKPEQRPGQSNPGQRATKATKAQ